MPSQTLRHDLDNYEINEPMAGAMIQSLRAFGYDLTTAVADIIDNSITAQAKNIWIHFCWDGEKSSIYIKDDGKGMSEEKLKSAMKVGSQNPLIPRDPKDLGRFGLGLKTASFSQCKRLTVFTKQKKQPVSIRCWDLDYVTECGEWRLLKQASPESAEIINLDELEQGTIVLWENIDKLTEGLKVDNENDQDLFLEKAAGVRDHVGMVFHRFIESKKMKIWINDRPVKAWDPFLSKESATQVLTDETLSFKNKGIDVKPYILPHHSKIDSDTHELASGIKGWNAHQGFYVYRNNRMLVDGDWLGLGYKKEEHCKLARIQIDIPNDMDSEWEIDVKKSKAKPPAVLRNDLKRLAKLTRERATDIYRHRGKVISRQNAASHVFIWEQKLINGKVNFSINRKHPLIQQVLAEAEDKKTMNAMLKMIEETIPIPMIVLKNSENPDAQTAPFESEPVKEVLIVLEANYKALLASGLTPEQAKKKLIYMEPFNLYPDYVEKYLERLGAEQ